MARSTYIYFVRKATLERELLGAFTVKREANLWALRNHLEHVNLSRMRDGVHGDKTETMISWGELR